jgi:3-phenylpropionate/cinnamic acid dioxygenase small subunit
MTTFETDTTTTTSDAALDAPATTRLSPSDAAYGELFNFLIDEAALLDDDLHNEWLALLAEDVSYRMPVRKTLYRKDGPGFDHRVNHFNEDRSSLGIRVRRSVEIKSAYDRDPAPRCRRQITNVVVRTSPSEAEYYVTSYIVLWRNRFDAPSYDVLTAKREDVIRRTPDGLRIAKRLILADQSALGAPWMNVFM